MSEVRFSPAQLHLLEERLEELGHLLNVRTLPHWGDICLHLLPEVYAEPKQLPDGPAVGFPGSETKIGELSVRYGKFRSMLVPTAGLWHPGDARDGMRVEVMGETPDAPKRQQEREKKIPPPRKEGAKKKPKATPRVCPVTGAQRSLFDTPQWTAGGRTVAAWTRREAARLLGVRVPEVALVDPRDANP
jgi:hypothetical protein